MRVLFVALCAVICFTAGAQAQTPPPIESFTGDEEVRSASLSPTGRYVAFIRDQGETEQLVVIDLETNRGRPIQSVADDVGRLNWVNWKTDDRLLFSISQSATFEGRDRTGSRVANRIEDQEVTVRRVMAVNRDGSNGVQMFGDQLRSLAGGFGSTLIIDQLINDPEHILLTAQDNEGNGAWRANVNTGRAERVVNGDFMTVRYMTDGAGNPVLRMDMLQDFSGYRILRRSPNETRWTAFRDFRRTATATNSPDFQLMGPAPGTGRVYVLVRPDDRDLLGVYILDTATGELSAPLFEGQQADIDMIWSVPATREIIASCESSVRVRCTSPDAAVNRQLRALQTFLGEDVTMELTDISVDGNIWLVYATGPAEPGAYYVFNRTELRAEPLGEVYQNMPRDEQTAPMQVVNYQSRDGVALWAYVTAQPGQGPRPTIIMPHGGPEMRDNVAYDPLVQFFASRGYVVVQPNFRGGLGFGRAFADAGRGQWGLRMQDDVTDAVQHMIASGVADPQRICIVGWSYGGYASLAGVTLTPDLYRCAISIAGVSNLFDALRSERLDNGRNSTSYRYWLRSIGDPNANRDALVAASPSRNAGAITAPVLLIHGDDDDIVQFGQSETMQRALQESGKPTRLIRMEGEGHYWARWSPESRATLLRESEAFLRQHIGPAN